MLYKMLESQKVAMSIKMFRYWMEKGESVKNDEVQIGM